MNLDTILKHLINETRNFNLAFPIVFMIHEFEEIIFMRGWVDKNKEHILYKYPKLGKQVLGQFGALSTESFCLIVAEEFLIVSFIVVYSVFTGIYDFYTGYSGIFYSFVNTSSSIHYSQKLCSSYDHYFLNRHFLRICIH
jgi:hypothetical protein